MSFEEFYVALAEVAAIRYKMMPSSSPSASESSAGPVDAFDALGPPLHVFLVEDVLSLVRKMSLNRAAAAMAALYGGNKVFLSSVNPNSIGPGGMIGTASTSEYASESDQSIAAKDGENNEVLPTEDSSSSTESKGTATQESSAVPSMPVTPAGERLQKAGVDDHQVRLYISGRTEELNKLERVMRSPDMLLAFFCKSPIMVVPVKRGHGSMAGSRTITGTASSAKSVDGRVRYSDGEKEVELVHVVLYNEEGKETRGVERQKRVLLQITPQQKPLPASSASGSGSAAVIATKESKDANEMGEGGDRDATVTSGTCFATGKGSFVCRKSHTWRNL